jgi:hypothetical protein
VKSRFSNNVKSIRGDALRRWRRTKNASARPPITAAAAATCQEGDSMAISLIAEARPTSPTRIRSEPTGSHATFRLASLRGMKTAAATSATTTTGTLIRKTEPHQKNSSRAPPISGPTAAPPEATAAQTPMASARSLSSSKVRRTIDKVAGIIIAAPTARSARPPIRMAGDGE